MEKGQEKKERKKNCVDSAHLRQTECVQVTFKAKGAVQYTVCHFAQVFILKEQTKIFLLSSPFISVTSTCWLTRRHIRYIAQAYFK